MTPLTIVLVVTCVLAAIWDIRTRQVPNWITLPALAAGLVLHTVNGDWRSSLLGLLFALAVGLPFFALHGLGGGDVKLMAAVGAIVGWPAFVTVFVIQAVLGGIVAVAMLLWRGGLKRALRNVGFILSEFAHMRVPHHDRQELDIASPGAITLPQAPVLAVAVFAWLLIR